MKEAKKSAGSPESDVFISHIIKQKNETKSVVVILDEDVMIQTKSVVDILDQDVMIQKIIHFFTSDKKFPSFKCVLKKLLQT